MHAAPFDKEQEADVEIPNIRCTKCTLQVIEFMAAHGWNPDGGYTTYHHCAELQIRANPEKPIDTRFPAENKPRWKCAGRSAPICAAELRELFSKSKLTIRWRVRWQERALGQRNGRDMKDAPLIPTRENLFDQTVIPIGAEFFIADSELSVCLRGVSAPIGSCAVDVSKPVLARQSPS